MNTLSSFACLAGLWAFVACTIGLILNGFPARGSFDSRRSVGWGAAALVAFVVWIVGMAHA